LLPLYFLHENIKIALITQHYATAQQTTLT
ncbi:MAG: hypothetical protein ACI90V_012636, partial [Bacillariaceae sp.]